MSWRQYCQWGVVKFAFIKLKNLLQVLTGGLASEYRVLDTANASSLFSSHLFAPTFFAPL
jgi:hypothetical protein